MGPKRIEPVAVPKPKPNEEDGPLHNVMLLEAQFLELASSIRALLRSNQQLLEALVDSPGDSDFMTAILENRVVIRKQRQILIDLVADMKRAGANMDVPDDIRDIPEDDMHLGSEPTDSPVPHSQDAEQEQQPQENQENNTGYFLWRLRFDALKSSWLNPSQQPWGEY